MTLPLDNRRILIVDDNLAIHRDFEKILVAQSPKDPLLDALEAQLFDTEVERRVTAAFELGFASQGAEALQRVTEAVDRGEPYALAFVDMRMPPGWDGLETIERIWRVDPDIQIVICSAYSDYSWSDMSGRLRHDDAFLIIKKPFETIEIVQAAHALTTKWSLGRSVKAQVDRLEQSVVARTAELLRANELLAEEIRERDRVEAELRLSQRLKAVGQLAAGIAHEINNPIQYVSDNLEFLRHGFEFLSAHGGPANDALKIPLSEEDAEELAFLLAEIPQTLETIENGIARVTSIVRSMREFAHPGSGEMAPADVNRALEITLSISGPSYRGVADVVTDLETLPPVRCHIADLNQVFLNLITNAAHAMEGRAQRGTLGIRTRVDGGDVVISISDTGCGIPEEVQPRIFDAFFTTKEVGRGTGQGLGIARTIVVDRHQGSLTFESMVGRGTTFHVRIPIAGTRRPRTQRIARPAEASPSPPLERT